MLPTETPDEDREAEEFQEEQDRLLTVINEANEQTDER